MTVVATGGWGLPASTIAALKNIQHYSGLKGQVYANFSFIENKTKGDFPSGANLVTQSTEEPYHLRTIIMAVDLERGEVTGWDRTTGKDPQEITPPNQPHFLLGRESANYSLTFGVGPFGACNVRSYLIKVSKFLTEARQSPRFNCNYYDPTLGTEEAQAAINRFHAAIVRALNQ